VAPRTAALLLTLFALAAGAFVAGLWVLSAGDDWMALALMGMGAAALHAVTMGARALEKGAR